MTKIRRQKRRKKYHYRSKKKGKGKKALRSKTIKEEWNEKATVENNFKKMGLVFDVNKESKTGEKMEVDEKPKTSAVKKLEKEAHAPRVRKFRLPKTEVQFLTYLINKYGDDYRAMSRDSKNYLQHTWKQIRHKINVFKNIPEQYNSSNVAKK